MFVHPRRLQLAVRGAALYWAFSLLGMSAPADNTEVPSLTGASFEEFMPSSAAFCLTAPNLGELDEGLRRAHAWRLRSLLMGASSEEASPLDLSAALSTLLGTRLSIDSEDLADREVGIAARSWSDFSGAVLFARAAEPAVIDRWFPVGRRTRTDRSQAVYSFRTSDGLIVIVRGDVVAMGRYAGRGSLLVEVMKLMRGASKDSIARSRPFQRLRAHLPPRELAVVYIAANPGGGEEAKEGLSLLPTLERVVVTLYEGDGRMELAIRGTTFGPVFARGRLQAKAVERLLSLPRTTLMAAGTTLDVPRLVDAAEAGRSGESVRRAWALFSHLRRLDAPKDREVPRVGPSILVAWDQDFSGDGAMPQLAVLLECADARKALAEVTRLAGNMLRVLAAVNRKMPREDNAIEQSRHLGVTVHHVSLAPLLSKSSFPFARLLSKLQPAWAASGDWLILALGRGHLERILDARFGLVPTLGLLDDTRPMRRNPNRQTGVFLVQGGLAADVMDRWLEEAHARQDSLLAPAWWDRVIATELDQRLGARLQNDGSTGFVEVRGIVPATPAADGLRVGDRIVAINGRVLDPNAPVDDLRHRMFDTEPDARPLVRVIREGEGMDVPLPSLGDLDRSYALQVQPAEAVRELAALFRSIPFATFVGYATDERHYSARVTVRLGSRKEAGRVSDGR